MKRIVSIIASVSLAALPFSCVTQRKLGSLRTGKIQPAIEIPSARDESSFEVPASSGSRDTLVVKDPDGHDVFIMRAVRDSLSGDMVASDVIRAAVVVARFRNVAERHGKVNISFRIEVPQEMLDPAWQMRLRPSMHILSDTVALDAVYITGKDYRKEQLRGYDRYNRFLKRIVSDTTVFIDSRKLEIFIERNIPALYAFKSDSSIVSEERFLSVFGVTEADAVEHYTNHIRAGFNRWLISRRGRMYGKYVKAPIVTEGLRLDTVFTADGRYVYDYVQELNVASRRRLKRVDVVLEGDIWRQGDCIYTIPPTNPITFYISSISSFADGTERYLKKVISRRVGANATYNIGFGAGKAEVDPDLGGNAGEIGRIRQQLLQLLENNVFDLDSVVVVASASPEGSLALNSSLSKRRAENIARFFSLYMKGVADSINTAGGLAIGLDGEFVKTGKIKPIKFLDRYIAEDWSGLSRLVESDTVMSLTQKEEYFALLGIESLDARDMRMQREPWYRYLKENLYPRLRYTKFEFALHRKGMVKDTIETTVPDTVYMAGVQAIRDREYERAAELLGPYQDFNTAVAYSALDRNRSALSILEREDMARTAEVNYLLAILYSRLGDDRNAVQHYMDACAQNGTYVHRGNLDPEIFVLIQRYALNRQAEENF